LGRCQTFGRGFSSPDLSHDARADQFLVSRVQIAIDLERVREPKGFRDTLDARRIKRSIDGDRNRQKGKIGDRVFQKPDFDVL
jgi:hypothetical protein